MWIIITILVGIIGGLTCVRLKMPAGAIIGSLIAVIIFNVSTDRAIFPEEFKMITQIGTGAYIGARISKKDVLELKKIVKPAFILTIVMCIFNLCVGVFLSRNTSIDLVTALFATAPAGLSDMTLISVDFGADSSKVAVLQLIRLISVITIMPTLIKFFISKRNKECNLNSETVRTNNSTRENKNDSKDFKETLKRTIYTLGVAFVFGYLGYFLDVPAGVISFSMIACAYHNIKTSKAYMPLNLRRGIQVFGGCLIGAKITMEQVISMKELLPFIVVIIIGYILLTFVLAFIITINSTLDITTALFSSAPGGLTDMTIISSEMGADAPKVAALQFTRIVTVVSFYPIIIEAFAGLMC